MIGKEDEYTLPSKGKKGPTWLPINAREQTRGGDEPTTREALKGNEGKKWLKTRDIEITALEK